MGVDHGGTLDDIGTRYRLLKAERDYLNERAQTAALAEAAAQSTIAAVAVALGLDEVADDEEIIAKVRELAAEAGARDAYAMDEARALLLSAQCAAHALEHALTAYASRR